MSWPFLVLFLVSSALSLDETNIHSEEFIRDINEAQDSWRAGINFHPGSFVKNLWSALPMREEKLPLRKIEVKKNLPKSFDARKNWKRCAAIGRTREQGNCASAWALVAAGVMTDRICISNIETVEISAQNILSCCRVCGVNCLGGYVTDAFQFLRKKGAPSKRCHPYEIFGCPKIGVLNCGAVRAAGLFCRGYCRKVYHKRWPIQDLRHVSETYSLASSGDTIMSEIMSKGPVAAVIDLYEDFLQYKTGVYFHTAGRLLAHHPVKVVGWGQQEDRPYWLVVNTWSSVWGDQGVVKIARDTNGCSLEKRVFALTPLKQ